MFIVNDFQFIDVTGQVISELSVASIDVVDRVRITWRIQKNRQNNQKVTLSRDKTNQRFAPFSPHYVWCSEHVAFQVTYED